MAARLCALTHRQTLIASNQRPKLAAKPRPTLVACKAVPLHPKQNRPAEEFDYPNLNSYEEGFEFCHAETARDSVQDWDLLWVSNPDSAAVPSVSVEDNEEDLRWLTCSYEEEFVFCHAETARHSTMDEYDDWGL